MKVYPEIKAFEEWFYETGDGHRVKVYQVGNPQGIPVVYLHGGPGAGITERCFRLFDPQKFHVVLLDQRGAGKSEPRGGVENNTTAHLIKDLEGIRKKLGFKTWSVSGGSWGSTLAMVYAQNYPEAIDKIVLRGIFLGREEDLEWFYRWGVHKIFPKEVLAFQSHLNLNSEISLTKQAADIVLGDNKEKAIQVAKDWLAISQQSFTILPMEGDVFPASGDKLLQALRITAHYFSNLFFLSESQQILDNLASIKHIPIKIVQGKFDIICPMEGAYLLEQALPHAELIVVEQGAHSAADPKVEEELIKAHEWLGE